MHIIDSLRMHLFALKKKKTNITYKSFKDIDFDKLRYLSEIGENNRSIDHITWNDLNMNEVYYKLNYTLTSPGEETLYSWLKNPLTDQETLCARQNIIEGYDKKSNALDSMNQPLSRIGYYRFRFKEVIEKGFVSNRALLLLFMIISALNIFVIVYSLLTLTTTFIPFMILTSIINFFIHYKFIRDYGYQFETLSYIIRLIDFGSATSSLIIELDPSKEKALTAIMKTMKQFAKKQRVLLRVEGVDALADYLNILFLTKEINLLLIADKVKQSQHDLILLYNLIGEVDATISILKYRQALTYYCVPEVNLSGSQINIKDMYHPLVDQPISNTVKTNQSIAITGSNMSGKSTFLRSIGVNTLLAQSICTSLSKGHSINFCKIISSISLNDDLMDSKSYFLKEAEAIKRMIDNRESDDIPTLILIDEIFKGTNPVERLAAATEILNILADNNTHVIVATHDLQILHDLHHYDYYYFSENVNSNALEFDYKLHKGIVSTRNAIRILEYLEYPRDVIQLINKRVGCESL